MNRKESRAAAAAERNVRAIDPETMIEEPTIRAFELFCKTFNKYRQGENRRYGEAVPAWLVYCGAAKGVGAMLGAVASQVTTAIADDPNSPMSPRQMIETTLKLVGHEMILTLAMREGKTREQAEAEYEANPLWPDDDAR